MIVYAESSAVLAWLLGEPTEALVREALQGAERVVTSALTATECARALTRARLNGRITPTAELAAMQLLDQVESSWDVHGLTDRVLVGARAPIPADPVRMLDVLHLATAVLLREALGPLAVLSLDDRLRVSASGLGFALIPASTLGVA